MTGEEYNKIVRLMNCGALHGIDTDRIDGKCEDVIPLEDAIAIVDLVYKTEQEPCDDVVSRQAVLDAFWKLNVELRPNAIDAILNMVNDISPVTPQPKTGYWIYKRYDGYPECGDYHCSECDKIDNRTPAYCPHCGCAMIEPQERSEE